MPSYSEIICNCKLYLPHAENGSTKMQRLQDKYTVADNYYPQGQRSYWPIWEFTLAVLTLHHKNSWNNNINLGLFPAFLNRHLRVSPIITGGWNSLSYCDGIKEDKLFHILDMFWGLWFLPTWTALISWRISLSPVGLKNFIEYILKRCVIWHALVQSLSIRFVMWVSSCVVCVLSFQ